MVKRKVEFIQNEKKRKTTYKKRSANIKNKLTEITTLCGVEACAIINSPYQERPQLWPPSHEAVHGVLQRFKSLPESMRTLKSVTPEDLVQKQIRKVREQLLEQERQNRNEEIRAAISQMLQHGPGAAGLLYQMSMEDFSEVVSMLNQMQKDVDEALSKCAGTEEIVDKPTGAAANPGNVLRSTTGEANPVNTIMGITGAANVRNFMRIGAAASNPGSALWRGAVNTPGNLMWPGAASSSQGRNVMWPGAANYLGNNGMWTGAAASEGINGDNDQLVHQHSTNKNINP
ncbi:hypothetical protein QQ045_022396 [Rhodiola kirilowii]